MAYLWQTCFKFVFRYSFFAFLPPFTTPFRNHFKYFTVSISLITLIRGVLIIVIDGKRNFEAYYILIEIMQITLRSITFVLQEKAFSKLFHNIDRALEVKNEFKTNFKDLWKEKKPERFIKYYTVVQVTSFTLWWIQAIYRSFFALEKISDSPIPLYSPFFRRGGGYRLLNIIFDSMTIASVVAQSIYTDVVTITMLHFGDCLFFHLKVLLKEIHEDVKGDDQSNYKKWIERHIQILNLINDLKNIMQPHILIQYMSTICGTVFNVLCLLEENSDQSFGQKFTAFGFISGLLFILGYECSIVERMLDRHGSMYDILLKSEFIYGKKNKSYFLRMLILRCQKPIRISGYGFFSMDMILFKNLTLQIYKLYSSLVSVKNKRRH